MFTHFSPIALHAKVLGELLDIVSEEGEIFESSVKQFLKHKPPSKTEKARLKRVIARFLKRIENLNRILSNTSRAAGIQEDS